MRASRSLTRFLTLLAFLLAVPAAMAQSSGASLAGRVADESGAALPGVTVTVTNVATGLTRTEVTGRDGGYRFPLLPVGKYTVTADLSGFASVTRPNVELNVATQRELNFSLKQAAVREQITVTAEAPLIATEPAVGTIVSQRELENLPLNGRQFANLGSLAPGTTLSVNSDPTKPGQLTIALNGGSGRNVNYLIDGGDNTDDTIGGALQNFNLEAVQEFKIQTMQYKAEYGRSSGGVLTVVTKTGTNDLSGSAYGFFRNKGLNGKTKIESDNNLPKSDYKRQQYGASLGGPIIRDRVHYFGTYEKLKRDTAYVIDTGGVFPAFDNQAVATPFTDELATAKVTANLTSAQFLQVRYGYQKNTDTYGASPLALPSFLGTTTNKYRSVLLGHSWQLSGSRLNDFIYQYTKFRNGITGSSDPYLVFPSGVVSGANPNTPQATQQEKSQFKDDFSWSSTLGGSRHDFKTGVNYIHEPILSGDFTVGTAGEFHLLTNDPNSPVTQIIVTGGFSGQSTPIEQYGVYLQDDWNFRPNLTFNLGLRYDLATGFDIDQSSNPIFQMLRTQRKFTEGYLQEFWNAPDKLKNDKNNFAPRLGFTYDLRGDSTHVIRGGAGRFYDFAYTNATILFPTGDVQSIYGTVYERNNATGIRNADGSFYRAGTTPLPPGNEAPPLARPEPGNVAAPSITNTPYSDQYSLGYSWQASPWLGFNFEAVRSNYKDIPFRFRANPSLDQNGNPIAARRFAEFGHGTNWRLWQGGGRARYSGFNIGAHGRFGQNLEFQGFYTYSKTNGNVLGGADEFRLTGADFQPDMHRNARDASINSLNPWCSACFGPLFSDTPHRFTFSGVYRAPFGINLSGVYRFRSGYPYTRLAGTDLNHDLFNIDLVPGVSHVNTERGDSFSQLDLRVGKEFRFGGNYGVELIGEVFNLFNRANPAKYQSDGQPTTFAGADPTQGEQRVMQLGARFRF